MVCGTWNISTVLKKITLRGMPVTVIFGSHHRPRPRPRPPRRRRRRRRRRPPPPPPSGSVQPVHFLQTTDPRSTTFQSNGPVWRQSMLPRWKIYETNTTF